MTAPHAQLLAQDATPWRGLGVAALLFGGCVFLALLLLHMALCALRDLLIWLEYHRLDSARTVAYGLAAVEAAESAEARWDQERGEASCSI